MKPICVAILTVSDRCSQGEAMDLSGPALAEVVRERLAGLVVAEACVPDDRGQIADQLRGWAIQAPRPDIILTTGGTGLAPRDVTPEATLDVIERRHAGLMELVRLRCLDRSRLAFLSRGEAGTLAGSLIVNLPGSPRGAVESLAALCDVLPHAVEMLRGENLDHGQQHSTPQ